MVGTLAIAAALFATGQQPIVHSHNHMQSGGRITPPGPGYGWGFPNGQPDGYGWVDYGTTLPLGADRTPDYFFRRQFSVPANQLFFPTYYNPYVTRGQRYIPYTGCGGDHPAGRLPQGPATLPMYPGRPQPVTPNDAIQATPFTGVVEDNTASGGR